MLAGSDGGDCSTAAIGKTCAVTVVSVSEGAWHEPPQPQSKPRAFVGAATADTLASVRSLCVAATAFGELAIAMPGSHTIPAPAPSSESRRGS
jgi:hypothetical protein